MIITLKVVFQNITIERNDKFYADPQTDVATGGPIAAICVQIVNDQSVVQFTLIHTLCCVLHRRANRVIHCLKLFLIQMPLSDPYFSCDHHKLI